MSTVEAAGARVTVAASRPSSPAQACLERGWLLPDKTGILFPFIGTLAPLLLTKGPSFKPLYHYVEIYDRSQREIK